MKQNSFANQNVTKPAVLCELLKRGQVAEMLGCCPHTVQRLTRQGKLAAVVINSRFIRYRRNVVENFIANAQVQEAA